MDDELRRLVDDATVRAEDASESNANWRNIGRMPEPDWRSSYRSDVPALCAALRELDAELNEARAIALRMIRSVAPEVAERNEASSLADRLDLVSAALAGARTRKPTCWCEGLDKPFAGLVGELRFRNNHVVPLGPPHRDGCPKSKRPTEL